jgi:DNA-binding GntR family transcriptional regulator
MMYGTRREFRNRNDVDSRSSEPPGDERAPRLCVTKRGYAAPLPSSEAGKVSWMQAERSGRTDRKMMPVRARAYKDLKTLILSGRFIPGERLKEVQLGKELGISRTPIREALQKLELEGLIASRVGRGFIAVQELPREIEELFEIRAVLEGYALRVVCTRMTGAVLDELAATVEGAEVALQCQSPDAFMQWNGQFHDLLHALIADKRRLHRQIVTLRQHSLRYRNRTLHDPESKRRTVDGHHMILMALRLQDPDVCETAMREHIHQSKEDALRSRTGHSP